MPDTTKQKQDKELTASDVEQTIRILDTMNTDIPLMEVVKKMTALLPSLQDLKFDWLKSKLSVPAEGQPDTIVYLPIIIDPALEDGMVAGMIFTKNYTTKRVRLVLKYQSPTYALQPSMMVCNILGQPLLATQKQNLEKSHLSSIPLVKYVLQLEESPIYDFIKDEKEQSAIRQSLLDLMVNVPRKASLAELRKKQKEIGGKALSHFTFYKLPTDADHNGHIDDEELLSALQFNIPKQAVAWSFDPNNPTVIPEFIAYSSYSEYLLLYDFIDPYYAHRYYSFFQSKLSAARRNEIRLARRVACKERPFGPWKMPTIAPSNKNGNVKGGTFGCHRDEGARFHAALDLKADLGDPMNFFFEEGVIESIQTQDVGDFGKYITIKTKDHFGEPIYVLIAHFGELANLAAGDRIKAGTYLGTVGRTGNAKTAAYTHSHIQVGRSTKDFMNPQRRARAYIEELKRLAKPPSSIYLDIAKLEDGQSTTCAQREALDEEIQYDFNLDKEFFDPKFHLIYNFDEKGNCLNCAPIDPNECP